MKHARPSDVAFEPKDQLVFVRLEDGKIDLSVFFSNELGEPGNLVESMTAWIEDTAVAVIAPHFKISSPVDYIIEGYGIYGSETEMDGPAKPLLDAVRREMIADSTFLNFSPSRWAVWRASASVPGAASCTA